MKKMATILAGAMLMMGITGGVANAFVITYDFSTPLPVNGGYSSPFTDVQVETFDAPPLWSWTGNGIVRTGTVENVSSAPAYANPLPIADATNYVSVPSTGTTGTYTASPFAASVSGGDFNYFGIWWGSIDGANGITNTIKFYDNGVLVETVTGSQIIDPLIAAGSWTSDDNNRYVNLVDLTKFDTFELISNGIAFEADNIAVGNVVPEPGTMMLLGIGMLGMAVYGKRRMNKDA